MENIDNLRIEPWIHFENGIKELFRTDRVRLYQIIGIFQYTLIYGVICFYLGTLLETFFPDADETKESWKIAVEVLGQCFTLSVSLLYIRLFVKSIPAIPTLFMRSRKVGHSNLSTASYRFSEYQGELIVSIIFIGVQLNLLSKISILAKRVLNIIGLNKILLSTEKKINTF